LAKDELASGAVMHRTVPRPLEEFRAVRDQLSRARGVR
jgi:hypothetical protein